MFNHLKGYESIQLPTENIDGKRYYTTPEGRHYPSVTSVTGLMNRKWIEKWRKSVGEEKANKIAGQAAARGTRYHQLQEYKKLNPHLKQVIGAPNIISNKGSRAGNIDNHGFKEVLQKVGEGHPGSEVAKQHTRRTTKEIKTKQVLDKHRKLQARKKVRKNV